MMQSQPSDSPILDGFWLPAGLRRRLLAGAAYEIRYLYRGRVLEEPVPESVGVRWPRLETAGWDLLLEGLQAARRLDTEQFLARWEAALAACQPGMLEGLSELLPLLSSATGYAPAMLLRGLSSGNLYPLSALSAGLDQRPARASALEWQALNDPVGGNAGWLRFFPHHRVDRLARRLRRSASLYRPASPSRLALGYAAGNIPGTGFIVALLGGLANAAHPVLPAPALLVRNSRHEPLFTPWLFGLVERADPELVEAMAILVWDYEDHALQQRLIGQAGLMCAAAGDDTIAALEADRRSANPAARFHRHGHKVSFSAIDRESAGSETAAALGALDACLWDQNGCLSARVHFVEGDAFAYAGHLAAAMRQLAQELPRGAAPGRLAHRAFDTYHNLESAGRVSVFSNYSDGFVVAVDDRPWDAEVFRRAANTCMGRVAIVRPVPDLMDVPGYLRWLPPGNLQTVGLACRAERALEFARAAGEAGVTAVRSLGRAAFPNLASSWDGYLPLDAAYERPAGHWTGLEFPLDVTLPPGATGR